MNRPGDLAEWDIPKIMTAYCQITCTIPWLPCKQLPYLPEHPRISRMRRRDKLDLPLPSLTYKYFLLRYSSPILSFHSLKPTFLAAVLFENLKNSGKDLHQQSPESSILFFLLGRNGHQLRRPWGQLNNLSLPFTILLLYSYSFANLFTEYVFSFFVSFLFFQPPNPLGIGW